LVVVRNPTRKTKRFEKDFSIPLFVFSFLILLSIFRAFFHWNFLYWLVDEMFCCCGCQLLLRMFFTRMSPKGLSSLFCPVIRKKAGNDTIDEVVDSMKTAFSDRWVMKKTRL